MTSSAFTEGQTPIGEPKTILYEAPANHHRQRIDPTTKWREQRSTSLKERSAIPLACVPCRSRHVKCDGQTPCGRCTTEGSICHYLKSRRGWKGPRRHPNTVTQLTRGSTGRDVASNSTLGPQIDSSMSIETYPHPMIAASRPTDLNPSSLETNLRYGNVINEKPPWEVIPRASFTPPGLTDNSELQLVGAFFTHFHPAHPFIPPLQNMETLEQFSTNHLNQAIRFIGTLYSDYSMTEQYRIGLENALAQNEVPQDGYFVQSLLLFAIGLHMCDREYESAKVLRQAIQLALRLGMGSKHFASDEGSHSPMITECWRRTWWELFVLDGMFSGVNPTHYSAQLSDYESNVLLPCEEHDFFSGCVPQLSQSLQEYDDAMFSGEKSDFSSATYRIDAIRLLHKVRMVQELQQTHGDVDHGMVHMADVHLNNWKLHLPASKRQAVKKNGDCDEIIFEAHMIVYTCTIMLHRPRSDLNSEEAKGITTCISAYQRPLSSVGQELHTAKALQAAKDISALITLPCSVLDHTPFFSCAIVMSSVVFLSYWSFILGGDDTAIKEHIKLNIGVVKRQAEMWPIANTIWAQVDGVAQEIFHSRKAMMNDSALDGAARQQAFQGIVMDAERRLEDQDMWGSFVDFSPHVDPQSLIISPRTVMISNGGASEQNV